MNSVKNGSGCSKCKNDMIANGGESSDVSKVAHKLHQLESGQKKILQLLTSLEKELNSKAKFCCCSCPGSRQEAPALRNTSWILREEDSGQGDGERLVKIQLQDATTSTNVKHVGFRIDKSCQTPSLIPDSNGQNTDCSCGGKNNSQEIARLREELKKATAALTEAMAVKTTDDGLIDFGAQSPLNLFIQCFKEKYGLVVNPNDVAIFV